MTVMITDKEETTNSDIEQSCKKAPKINSTAPQQKSRPWRTVLIDFLFVYTLVPAWITLFSFGLNYLHIHYHKYFSVFWHNDVDITMFPIIFITIALPLTYLRFAASNPSHILHNYRIETKEKFLSDTRNNLPNFFKIDIILNILMMTVLQLSGILNTNTFNSLNINIFTTYYLNALSLLILFDALTYWMHRIVHIKTFYKHHKQHHKVRNSVAISLIDIDIVDFLINNASFIILPLIYYYIFNIQMIYNVWIISLAFMMTQGFIIHCDFKIFGLRKSLGLCWNETVDHHSYHHSKNRGNYGFCAPQIWDWICNTEVHWYMDKQENCNN